jgi:hypothetical protein
MSVDYVSTAPWNDPFNPFTAYSTLTVTGTGWPTITLTLTGFNPAGGLENDAAFSNITRPGSWPDNIGTINVIYITTQGYDLRNTPPFVGEGGGFQIQNYSGASNRYLALMGGTGDTGGNVYNWILIGWYPEEPAINPYPVIYRDKSIARNRTILKTAASPAQIADWGNAYYGYAWQAAGSVNSQDGGIVVPHLTISAGTTAPWELRRRRLLEIA